MLDLVVGVAAAVLAVVVSCIGWYLFFKGLSTNHWLATRGKIIRSETQPVDSMEGPQQHRIQIEYQYIVDGVEYVSNRISYRGHRSSRKSVAALAEQFRPGREVDVFYNPRSHNQAVLIPGSPPELVLCLLIVPPAMLGFAWIRLM